MSHHSDDQLRSLLADAEHDRAICVDDDLQQHLDDCHACQGRLAKLAGEDEWLSDWVDAVQHEPIIDDIDDQSSSVVIAVGSREDTADDVRCDAMRLDFLEAPTHPELLGRLGRYDIEKMIGVGGFGIVFKAHDTDLHRVVALKVLAPHFMTSGPARQRFAREAQAAAAVVHDHVAPIYDVVSDDRVCYLVMQYIAGESLQERVERRGPLPIEDVLRIAVQTGEGLHAAHQQGLIHRDVKPANILLEESVDRVLISDFGLARTADDASLTRSGAITGTPHYMSPEQANGEAVDPRSDLFSFGSVIYYMCTGRSPFRAPQVMAVLNRICHQPHRALNEACHDVPWQLSEIVDRLLAKSPDDRFDSSIETTGALRVLLNDYQSGRLTAKPTKKYDGDVYTMTSIGLIAAAGVVVIGMLVWGYFGQPTDTPVNTSPQQQVTEQQPTATHQAAVETQTTFEDVSLQQELQTLNQILVPLESHSMPTPIEPTGRWSMEVMEVQMMLNELEAEVSREDD